MEVLGWHSLGTSFECTCGMRHALPIEVCHVGEDAAALLSEFAAKRCGSVAMVLGDTNTRDAAGDTVPEHLRARGVRLIEKTYPAEGLEATQERADEVAAAGQDADFYVGIGAGTIADLVKDAGSKQGKPVLLFPTAASMNGYSSAIVALKVRGLKRTLSCAPATGIFADPSVAATAPQRMTAAGVADFLSKCSSAADWRAAHLLRGDYYCARPREFNEGIQERLFQEAGAIGRGDHEGVRLVLEALLLSGFGMVIAGSSAPASGGEHLLSHYLDMKHALYGTPNDLHGTQVGVGTLHTLGLWEKILALDAAEIDIEAQVRAQLPPDVIRAQIFDDWGENVGEEVWDQWTQKALDATALRLELERFRQMLPQLREVLARDLQPPAVISDCIRECGGPVTIAETTASAPEFEQAKVRARYLRNRFTVLDLAAELVI